MRRCTYFMLSLLLCACGGRTIDDTDCDDMCERIGVEVERACDEPIDWQVNSAVKVLLHAGVSPQHGAGLGVAG